MATKRHSDKATGEGEIMTVTLEVEQALQAQGRLADIWERQAQSDEGGNGGLAVGCENINYRWKTDAMRAVMARIREGEDPIKATEAVKVEAHIWIKRHNARRPKDTGWRRWEGSADDSIDGVLQAVLQAS